MSLLEALREQREAWEARPLLRRLYLEWYDAIVERLAPVPGPTVELGAGIGTFKERYPAAVATDLEPTAWTEEVVDAERLPYGDGSVANLVLVDVFHHLARPAAFLDEARRVLAPGGRAIVLDPYCSPVSYRAYRRFHHERTDLATEPFAEDATIAGAPMESNQAGATLAFFRAPGELAARWPELALVERRRLALLAYPLSGGFSRPPLLPPAAFGVVARLERLLAPLAPLLAFRCLVVLERR
jgi:SAM-dependent methyltransferase